MVLVKGAICVVAPIHWAVKPLKTKLSLLQVPVGSQATSVITPGGKFAVLFPKKIDIAESMLSVRFCHSALPFVYIQSVLVLSRRW